MTRVLVVEDEAIVATHLQATLERLGYEVPEVAASGEEALRLAGELGPGLVLMDVRLRGALDGIEAAARLRATSGAPVVFLTAHSDDAHVRRARRAQPYGYLLKPFNERELRTTIEVALFTHRAQRARAERARWFDAALRSAGDGVVAVDRSGRVIALNPAAERLTGWRSAEAAGEPAGRVVRLLDPHTGGARAPSRAGGPAGPVACAARGGGARPVEATAAEVVGDGGESLGTVIVVREVSAWRERERRHFDDERRASLGALAAGVAHEINNPLACALANLEFVRRGIADLRSGAGRGAGAPGVDAVRLGELEAAAADALDGGARVGRVVAGLRSYSQGRDGGGDEAVVELRPVIEGALRAVAPEVRGRAEVGAEFGDAPAVRASAEGLGRLFANLLLNAAQALPDGRAGNAIRVRTFRDGRGRAAAEVSDNGCGIAPDDVPRVFDPFFTTKPLGRGVGLGLSVARAVAEASGGELEVRSARGEGTTFRLTLPAAPAAGPRPARGAAAGGRSRPHVLVVDDEPALCAALKRGLGARCEVRAFVRAREALDAIGAGARCDVIVCDVMMPELDGVEFYRSLERARPELAARVVFMTGGALTAGARAFLDAAPRPWLPKPFDFGRLSALVDRVAAGGAAAP